MRDQIKSPAIRYHGSKFRLAPWVISHFPEHRVYVEPFGGAAGVLLQKERSYSEVYNDLDGEIVNFFSVLRDDLMNKELRRKIAMTPFSRQEFINSYEESEDPIERARRLAVRANMGFGSGGASGKNTGFRIDTKRKYSTAMHLWSCYPDILSDIGKRFSAVLIENKPALDVMSNHDSPETLHYIDPPYVKGTRKMGNNKKVYRHEMSDSDHEDLCLKAKDLSGSVIISGYENDIYNDILNGWAKEAKPSRISAGRGTGIRTETIWINERAYFGGLI